MPIFEYVCKSCNDNFEKLVRSSTKEILCPKCGANETEKKFSAFAVSGVSVPSGGSSCGSCSSHNCGSCH